MFKFCAQQHVLPAEDAASLLFTSFGVFLGDRCDCKNDAFQAIFSQRKLFLQSAYLSSGQDEHLGALQRQNYRNAITELH